MGVLQSCGFNMADMEGAEEGPVPLDDGPVEDEVFEDMDDLPTKGQTGLTFANATSREIFIKVKLLMQKNSRSKNFRIGVEADIGWGGVNLKGGVGESELEVLTWPEILHTVDIHQVSHLELPA